MSTTTPDIESEAMRDTSTRFQFGVPIGVDVGRRNLLSLARANIGPDLGDALALGSRRAEDLYNTIQHRYETESGEGIDQFLAQLLDAVLTTAADEALAYAQSFDAPAMLALEDLGYSVRPLATCVTAGLGPDCWMFPAVQQRLIGLARERGVPVAFVSEKYTTRECHVCGSHSKVRKKNIRCTNERCPVESVCRDRSAAATIANRLG